MSSDSFDDFADSALAAAAAAEPVYFNRRALGWAKRSFEISASGRDSRTCELRLTVAFGQSSFAPTAEAAHGLPRPGPNCDYVAAMRLSFHWSGSGWSFGRGKYKADGRKFVITAAKVAAEPDSMPYVVIRELLQAGRRKAVDNYQK